ncbi:MAG: 2-oxoacid:acceptor oxidoreductase family protein [Planctomycetota bacterium]|jgi:pyruvate-ferredoxin/flavodoxin oxidoreductase
MSKLPKYPGVRVVANGNQLVCYQTEARLADAGIFYPITPSTEMGELFQQSFAEGKLNVFGRPKLAIETEGEHSAQGGAIAYSVTGKRVVNFTSGQGVVYGIEQYYHAPGKFATMVVEVAARALTKHALNVHCGHDDIYAALDTGWIMLMAKDAQQAADQALIIRRVTELALTPGINVQDGFLTSHLERTFLEAEAGLIREYLGDVDDIIDCPTEAQRELFGAKRRRVPEMMDLKHPILLGPVQNQEHYMNGVLARRNNFCEPILGFLKDAYRDFAELTGRTYDFVTEYRTDGADTVFLSLGSAAENIEAAADYAAERGERFGSVHLNVIRPFPEEAVVAALKGKKNVIIIERTDEPLANDNPLTRDVRVALARALERGDIGLDEMPRILSGSYGLGSRDFRPEAVLGAYEFATGKVARQDGKTADEVSYFTLGIDHPYEVTSADRPSLLPDNAIAVRLHSIGGWGMITTGKNLGAIIGELGEELALKAGKRDEFGRLEELIHVSANPKYGSEKKGSPTSYFLVVAPERIRVNCDLRHVNVVLCCDPKAFTHMNPADGLADGGTLVIESSEDPEGVWSRIPPAVRTEIIERDIKIYSLPGFQIAHDATKRRDLQLRMQGNAFLGAFFAVSPFLENNKITREHFEEMVLAQYQKKFGRFGRAVVDANMQVMRAGLDRVQFVPHGPVDAADKSRMRGQWLLPVNGKSGDKDAVPVGSGCGGACQPDPYPFQKSSTFDAEFRAGLGYRQPASPLAALGMMAAGTGATASKRVARIETPVFIAENCTQCMACISACPDTALPNTAQDVGTVLTTAVESYVSDTGQRQKLLAAVPVLEERSREKMRVSVAEKSKRPFSEIIAEELVAVEDVDGNAKQEMLNIINELPLAYSKVNAVFGTREKKDPGQGGLFSIFVSDLCKGCGECVVECGDHEALVMTPDTVDLNTKVATGTHFLDLLPDTTQKYLGLYDQAAPGNSKAATLRNHLMERRNYDALVSGDGACAGCGEKSVLRALASTTEAYMRPVYHARADRLDNKAIRLATEGVSKLEALRERNPAEHERFRRATAHILMGLGGEDESDTKGRIADHGDIADSDIVDAITTVMHQDAFNHRDLRMLEGRDALGMSVMAMGASTGCNTVYGSTPPNNPHPYPWMNSLFQDGSTISWMIGESFIADHGRRSVLPERLCDMLLDRAENVIAEDEYFDLTHFSDALMTNEEVDELPRVWCVGGDGGLGDIGYQNLSKVILQNRPNVKILLLDTQVYSNTGGQNSDSTPMLGGGDMNQIGAATQGKINEKKSVAETLTAGHGSPYIAQVSMADQPSMYKAMLAGLAYRGTAFFQAFTTCQPEHGVPDDMSTVQAIGIRDSRGMPQFIYDPTAGETYDEALDIRRNPNHDRDWKEIRAQGDEPARWYTVAHWAATEARFRRHVKDVSVEEAEKMVRLDDILTCLTQQDTVHRNFLKPDHLAYVPDFGVITMAANAQGKRMPTALSRQMVLFCVERRKAWRLLQSKAGVKNVDYQAQRHLLKRVEQGELTRDDLWKRGRELLLEEVAELKGK